MAVCFSVSGIEHLTQITCQCWRLCPAVLMARTALHWSAALAPQTRTNKRQTQQGGYPIDACVHPLCEGTASTLLSDP